MVDQLLRTSLEVSSPCQVLLLVEAQAVPDMRLVRSWQEMLVPAVLDKQLAWEAQKQRLAVAPNCPHGQRWGFATAASAAEGEGGPDQHWRRIFLQVEAALAVACSVSAHPVGCRFVKVP